MTINTIKKIVDAWAHGNRHDLWRSQVEIETRMVGDGLLIVAKTFPDPTTKAVRSVSRLLTLPELAASPEVRAATAEDPKHGLEVYVHGIIQQLGAALSGGTNAVQGEQG